MKITVVCDVLGEENNGTTIAGMNLIRSLKEKGHDVKVVCPDTAVDAEFITVPRRSFGIFNDYVKRNGVVLARPDENVLRGAIEGAEVIHVLLPFGMGKMTVRLAKEMNIPVTAGFHFQAENLTAHVGMQHYDIINNVIYKTRWNEFYRYVDCIHYPTAFIRNVFENAIGKETVGRVISNGVNRDFVYTGEMGRDPSGKFTIVCTGRYSREKSQTTLIHAAKLSKYADNIKIIFAGDGPLRDKLVEEARELGVDATFAFFTRSELIKILRSADLYVHTAEVEIEAIACLEAIASGLVPVIANSPRSATKDYALDKTNLYEFGNPASLAAMIDFWHDNPELKAAARAKYADFTKEIEYDVCMNKMEQMLIDTAAAKTRPAGEPI